MAGETNAQAQTSIDDAEHVMVRNTAGKFGAITWANFVLLVKAFMGKGDVGLGSVDNTADADKPISTDVQTGLDAKVDTPVGDEGEVLSPDGAGGVEAKDRLEHDTLTIDGGLI